MSYRKSILFPLAVGAIGVAGNVAFQSVYYIGKFYNKPAQVYVLELNGDGCNDVVVRTRAGKNYVFLAQPDGAYRTPDELQDVKALKIVEPVKKQEGVMILEKGIEKNLEKLK